MNVKKKDACVRISETINVSTLIKTKACPEQCQWTPWV